MDEQSTEVASITSTDPETNDENFICVRCGRKRIYLAVSSRSDGDTEIAFNLETCNRLIEALGKAASRVSNDAR
jgi:hypothetical protein